MGGREKYNEVAKGQGCREGLLLWKEILLKAVQAGSPSQLVPPFGEGGSLETGEGPGLWGPNHEHLCLDSAAD